MTIHPFQFDTLVWDWPIALYLLCWALPPGWCWWHSACNPLYPGRNAAGLRRAAIGAPVMVSAGLLVLVFHLTHPLSFWYVMVFYNPHSVMSLGVMLFQLFFRRWHCGGCGLATCGCMNARSIARAWGERAVMRLLARPGSGWRIITAGITPCWVCWRYCWGFIPAFCSLR